MDGDFLQRRTKFAFGLDDFEQPLALKLPESQSHFVFVDAAAPIFRLQTSPHRDQPQPLNGMGRFFEIKTHRACPVSRVGV
jgi:hypothetical protein